MSTFDREEKTGAGRMWLSLVLLLTGVGLMCSGAELHVPAAMPGSKKALIFGRGDPFHDPDGSPTHPQIAKNLFLKLVGNPNNDPKKGWTADLSWDLMVRLGMNPTNTPVEQLFDYLGQNKLGYRIVINNSARGQSFPQWDRALDNELMPFAPQGNNEFNYRFEEPPGLRAATSVAGGTAANQTSYGPTVEFIDALPLSLSHANFEDAAQSWANQVVAAKFAHILDTHPIYNIYDARQHLRQAASFWSSGWTEKNGYGRVAEKAVIGELLPGPPLEFGISVARDRHRVTFSWRNFLQSDFASTVITRKDGRVIYEGTGTNTEWAADLDGDETFTYKSKNKAGKSSRIESFQTRQVTGLKQAAYLPCLVLGAPPGEESVSDLLCQQFQQSTTNWTCDVVYRKGNPGYDNWTKFPSGSVVAILPDFRAMISYAISNRYRMVLVPVTPAEQDLYRFKTEWDRATAAGILVVMPHHGSLSMSRKPEARRLSPPRLFSAVTIGAGTTNNVRSFGPGLEFFDAPSGQKFAYGAPTELEALPVLAAKLAQLLETHPAYNLYDARQHLRQSSSYYTSGWVEDGGYGRPPQQQAQISGLDPGPPLEIQATKSTDGKSVTFSWLNFLQTGFAETVIVRNDGRTVYHGAGTNVVWQSDLNGEETFKFFSKNQGGRLSKTEAYTAIRVEGLQRN